MSPYVLLTTIGTKTYTLLWSLTAPTLPHDKSFEDLASVLTAHFQPKPVLIAERFHFHRCDQAASDSFAAVELWRLSTHCVFGELLENALHDRLVCGMKNISTQKCLLADPDLTFKSMLPVWEQETWPQKLPFCWRDLPYLWQERPHRTSLPIRQETSWQQSFSSHEQIPRSFIMIDANEVRGDISRRRRRPDSNSNCTPSEQSLLHDLSLVEIDLNDKRVTMVPQSRSSLNGRTKSSFPARNWNHPRLSSRPTPTSAWQWLVSCLCKYSTENSVYPCPA